MAKKVTTKICVVTFTSYTQSDNYLHTEQKVFSNPLFAQDYYEDQCADAHSECQWGEEWNADENERENAYEYPVSEKYTGRMKDLNATYEVSSEAYCGYQVKVALSSHEVGITL